MRLCDVCDVCDVCVYVSVCVYVRVLCVCVCMCVCMCDVCVCVYVYVYVCVVESIHLMYLIYMHVCVCLSDDAPQIVFGRGKLATVGDAVSGIGGSKVMVVVGRNTERARPVFDVLDRYVEV